MDRAPSSTPSCLLVPLRSTEREFGVIAEGSQVALRARNGASSAVASIVPLLSMSFFIGGTREFAGIVQNFSWLFLAIACIALALGALLRTRRIWWSLLLGAISGIASGAAIVWAVTSRI